MDTARLRQLLDQRDRVDAEIVALVTGSTVKKPQVCSICGQPGHSSRTCPQKPAD